MEKLGRSALGVLALMAVLMAFSCGAAEKRRNEAVAHYKLGVSHLMSGNTQAAYIKFHRALKLDSKNKEIHNALGNVYIHLKELDNAEKQFLRAMDIDGDYSEAHNNLCYIHYIRGKYKEAIRNCRKALENHLYATPEKAFYNIGRSYYRLGDYPEAIKAFTDAVKRFPNFYQGCYGLALAYNADKMYGEAAGAMADAIGFDPRFHGDKRKAEREFLNRKAEVDELKDLRDYIEILHY